jgi:hypothetical protein
MAPREPLEVAPNELAKPILVSGGVAKKFKIGGKLVPDFPSAFVDRRHVVPRLDTRQI